MPNPKTPSNSRIIFRLNLVKNNVPYCPPRQRALRFIRAAQNIHVALQSAGPDETLDLLSHSTDTLAAIMNHGQLTSDDQSSLSYAFIRLMKKNIYRLGSAALTTYLARIAPALQADYKGFVPLMDFVLPHLDDAQLKNLDRILRHNPSPASNPYHDCAGIDRLQLRRKIAYFIGDMDLFVKLDVACQTDAPFLTARMLLKVGRPIEALDKLEEAMTGMSASSRSDRLRAEIQDALGEKALAQDLRISSFRRDLCAHALRDYLKRLPNFDDILAEEEALTYAATFPDTPRSVLFFLAYGRPDLAAGRVLEDPDRWTAVDHWGQDHAAEDLAPEWPRAASILLRGRITRILLEKYRYLFPEARNHLKDLSALATLADADDRHPGHYDPHAVWLAGQRELMFTAGFFRSEARFLDAA
jgi:hypothetical protein